MKPFVYYSIYQYKFGERVRLISGGFQTIEEARKEKKLWNECLGLPEGENKIQIIEVTEKEVD
jgi:hypothetical protein